jgi:MAF protein
MSSNCKIVLASGSPYRKAILEKLQIDFITDNASIDETPIKNETPQNLALRLCKLKASALRKQYNQHLIIGSDQVVMLDGMQLNKPDNHDNCIKQLESQAGKQIFLFSAVGVLDSQSGKFMSALDISSITFKNLTLEQINRYVNKEKPYDCAGAFKSEGLGIALFNSIKVEDPNALVGLPLLKLIRLLENFNYNIL